MSPHGTARGPWTEADDAFLCENYVTMRPEDIGAKLGRSAVAVGLRGRKLGLRKPHGAFGKSWSDADEAFLRENYLTMPIRQIAGTLGRSYQAVTVHAGKLGLPAHTKTPWTEPEDDYLRANRAAMSTHALATHLGRPWPSVRLRVRALGLANDANEAKLVRRAAIRNDYFSEIDTPLKAYVLGWIASDGCISRNEISLKLHEKDIEAVELVRDELAPLHKITHRQDGNSGRSPMAEFRVSSAQMREDLEHLGITPRKSLTLRYPEILPHLNNSFILGCFDGDGCLYRSPAGYYRWTLVSASVPFLREVQERVLCATGIRLSDPRKNVTSEAHVIGCTGSKVVPVDTWLHADMPGLARKRLPGRMP
jgi:hypothetical protein